MGDFKRYKIETKSVKQKRKVVELFEQLGYRDFSTAGVHLNLITYEDGDIQSVVDFGWATSAFESITVSELKALVSAKQQHTEDTHMKPCHIQCSDLHERAEVIEMLESIGCHSSLVNSDHLSLRVHDRGIIQTVVDFVCAEHNGSTLITVKELREMTGFDTTLSVVKHYLDGGDIQVKNPFGTWVDISGNVSLRSLREGTEIRIKPTFIEIDGKEFDKQSAINYINTTY